MTLNQNNTGTAVNGVDPSLDPQADFFIVHGMDGDDEFKKDLEEATRELQALIAEISASKDVTSYQLFAAMYLMQRQGGDIAGEDGVQKQILSGTFDQLNNAWNTFYQADNPNADGKALYQKFVQELESIVTTITGNSDFFKNNVDFVSSLISSVASVTAAAGGDNNQDDLKYLWEKYDPTQFPSTSGASAEPAVMDGITRGMSQLNSQLTGGSQTLDAVTKTDAKQYSTIYETTNNWIKDTQKIQEQMIRMAASA